MNRLAKIALALKEAAGLGHFGASNVRVQFTKGLKDSNFFHHEESGIKAKKVLDKRLPVGHEYILQHPDGRKLSFDHDELDTLAERASMWADRIKLKK